MSEVVVEFWAGPRDGECIVIPSYLDAILMPVMPDPFRRHGESMESFLAKPQALSIPVRPARDGKLYADWTSRREIA